MGRVKGGLPSLWKVACQGFRFQVIGLSHSLILSLFLEGELDSASISIWPG